MSKIFGWAIGVVIIFVAVLIGLNIFLSPNSLMDCQSRPSNENGCKKADVIVAVSGGNTNQRTQHAIDLYKNGWASKLMFSGADSDPSRPSNAENMRDQAIEAGVPKSAILTEETSKNTHENAINVAEILREIDARDVILVSSPYHMRRVELEFSAADSGAEFRTSPVESKTIYNNWWISPRGWLLAFYELGGIVAFYIRGVL